MYHLQCEPHYHPGAIPYEDLPMNSLMAHIVGGYRLPMPEHATDKLWVHALQTLAYTFAALLHYVYSKKINTVP